MDKKNTKKILNGFTLVELLAVIVILAIIMIIAIPSVLNTLQSSRKKTMLEYAQKVMNKAEEVYLENSLLGNNVLKAERNILFYDVKEDLGLSSTGDFKGFTYLDIVGNYINKGVFLIDNENILSYETYYDHEISIDDIHPLTNDDKFIFSMNSIDIKKHSSYNFLHMKCNNEDIAVIDMTTRSQIFCTNPAKSIDCDDDFDILYAESKTLFENNNYNTDSLTNCG